MFSQCKIPITSFGIILFRINPQNEPEYLMIRRRDTLGFIDFLRGKYSLQNKYYIVNMVKQMTTEEKHNLRTKTFDEIWSIVWGKPLCNQYKMEEIVSKEKFEQLREGVSSEKAFFSLETILDECESIVWTEPEWGFPKGRRNYKEKDYNCALREFREETGYDVQHLKNFQNIFPFEEIFMGSNYKSYKHKYYLTYIDYEDSLKYSGNYQKTEVSKLEWKRMDECLSCVRHYNLEKKRLLKNIHECLTKYKICQLI
jgi:8-oxo-dGTP pyrophosphatase MutT (NUDIX family)